MPSTLNCALKVALQDAEIIFSYLSNPNNLADSDGEHVRAILARSGHHLVIHAQDLIEESEAG